MDRAALRAARGLRSLLAVLLLGCSACAVQPAREASDTGEPAAASTICLGEPPAFGFCGDVSPEAAREYPALFAALSTQAWVSVASVGGMENSVIADGREARSALVLLRAGGHALRMRVNAADLRQLSLRAGNGLSLRAVPAGLMLGKEGLPLALIPSPALLALSGHMRHEAR